MRSMPLDPTLEAMLPALAPLFDPPNSALTPVEARERVETIAATMAANVPVAPVGSTTDVTIPGPGGPLPLRVYRPDGDGHVPTVVFLHGGGFVLGSIATHDPTCRDICRATGAVVVSVGYRLAPESPFPAAVEDALAATRWAAQSIATLGGDPSRLAVAGDSAGGNLAAVVAQQCRDAGEPSLCAQLLIYPAVDETGDYPSRIENQDAPMLTLDDMVWFLRQYVHGTGEPGDPDATQHEAVDARLADPRLAPLRHPDLSGLPAAVVVTAEFDPLRDEGEAYAAALGAAGVPVVARRYDGLIHGFFAMRILTPAAASAIDDALEEFAAAARGALSRGCRGGVGTVSA